jgi:Flp pilus assembly protein TadD
MYHNCSSCHHPGGAGPFSLMTYEDARRWAPQILRVTQTRYMPPWLPETGYGDLADSRHLSDAQLATIRSWVNAGMPRGGGHAPGPPVYSSAWTLGEPDLILTVKQPYPLAAGGDDVFRNFILPYPLDKTHYIRAMEILPSVPRAVHHANVLIDRTAEYRHQHADDWQQGVAGMELVVDAGKSFDPDGHFLFWKPDTPAIVEPEKMPWRLDPGNDLILNMHLKPSGKAETIDAKVGLYFTDRAPSQLPMLLQLDRDDALDIPAGQPAFTVEDTMTLPVNVLLLAIYPHAHYLGKEMQAWAILPNGTKQWLIWIRSWDIDRQSVYHYRNAVFLPKGTTVHMRYTYDNSAANPHNPHDPPVRVKAGNRSEDEMSHLWLQVLPAATQRPGEPDPRLLLEEAWMRSRLQKVPGDYISLYNLGAALTGEGKDHDAAVVFREIVQSRPDDSRGWNALGAAVERSGDWQQAEESFTRALAADPGNCDALFNRSQLELKHEQAQPAEAGFLGYLARCPEDAEAHAGLAAALVAQENYNAAQPEYLHALAMMPASAETVDLREQLAFAYVQTGRLADAAAQLREAVKQRPDDAHAYSLLSQVLAQMGEMAAAIAEQKRALQLHPDDAGGWNNLGVFEARAGDDAAARRDFEQAERLDPGNAEAKANLDRLTARH